MTHDPICELAEGKCICNAVRDVMRHARTMEREKIAAAIEAAAIPVTPMTPGLEAHHLALELAARIARSGGSDEQGT